MCTLGMEKRDLHVMGAGAWLVVDHLQSRLLQFVNPVLDVVDREGEVMQSFASLFEKLCNRSGGIGRFQQFESHIIHSEKPDSDLLAGSRSHGLPADWCLRGDRVL